MGTANFRAQHEKLLELLSKLAQRLDTQTLTTQARTVRAELTLLAGKVTIHLTMEDKGLYPRIMASGNAEATSMAMKFQREMGNLSTAFMSFNRKWLSPDDIEERPEQFAGEALLLIGSLRERINREDEELYPLVDAL